MLGKFVALSISRKFLIDLFWIAKRVPMSVIGSSINIEALIAARNNALAPPAYTAIFAKALAIVAHQIPELRRNYVKYPVPHFYETYDVSVSVLVERDIDGEVGVIPILVRSPSLKTLVEIAREILSAKSDPQGSVGQIRRLLKLTRLPLPVRRLLWLTGYHSGRLRANYFGTFAISTLGYSGHLITFPLSPVTTFLTYGSIEAGKSVEIRIAFDHRVYDGAIVSKTMAALEHCLNHDLVIELQMSESAPSALKAPGAVNRLNQESAAATGTRAGSGVP